MALMLLRRGTTLTSLVNPHFLSRLCSVCSKASTIVDEDNETTQTGSLDSKLTSVANYSSRIDLSPLFSSGKPQLNGYGIELVDQDAWQVSWGLAHAWRGLDREMEIQSLPEEVAERFGDDIAFEGDPDFDDIDNMRIRGNLFYKLDRGSREFEEYSFDFHKRKSLKRKDNHKGQEKVEPTKKRVDNKGSKKENLSIKNPSFEKLPEIVKNDRVYNFLNKMDGSIADKKRVRSPTFHQLTGPYHEPFCLDIYISKASVRACIVHRVTSKVVAVAHSISKDMKFDLASTRNAAACAAVGGILAQRALADDIHDVVYTPRKGEKLEGKLQIVLKSIIDNGVNVKVRLKLNQRKPRPGFPSA